MQKVQFYSTRLVWEQNLTKYYDNLDNTVNAKTYIPHFHSNTPQEVMEMGKLHSNISIPLNELKLNK